MPHGQRIIFKLPFFEAAGTVASKTYIKMFAVEAEVVHTSTPSLSTLAERM